MWATVRRYPGNRELVDALAENEDAVRRVLAGIEGFRGYYLIRTEDGEALSVSIFEDESGVEESNRAAAAWLRENLPELAGRPPEVIAGEVVIAG